MALHLSFEAGVTHSSGVTIGDVQLRRYRLPINLQMWHRQRPWTEATEQGALTLFRSSCLMMV